MKIDSMPLLNKHICMIFYLRGTIFSVFTYLNLILHTPVQVLSKISIFFSSFFSHFNILKLFKFSKFLVMNTLARTRLYLCIYYFRKFNLQSFYHKLHQGNPIGKINISCQRTKVLKKNFSCRQFLTD